MTILTLPEAPDVQGLSNVDAVEVFAHWLKGVARALGEPAVQHAAGAGWPGTAEQRKILTAAHNAAVGLDCSCHICSARNVARQLGNDERQQKLKAANKWGV